MRYEPYRKICYRFPSAKSIEKFDSKLYFPDKPSFTEEDIRFTDRGAQHVTERETFRDL